MKRKIFIVIAMLILLIFCSGITYSLFHSSTNLNSNDQDIAKFIFNAKNVDQIELPLIDLNPGDTEEYNFSVSNNQEEKISQVSVNYQLIIKTYHLVPLIIELYKVVDEDEELIMTCDETYTRNAENELICNSPIQELEYSKVQLDNYKLKVKFSDEYTDAAYANLVDYINVEIKSWQKTND